VLASPLTVMRMALHSRGGAKQLSVQKIRNTTRFTNQAELPGRNLTISLPSLMTS